MTYEMKFEIVAIWCVGFLPLSLVGASAELAAAYRNGAMSRVVYRVIDNHGGIVSNAIAHVWYRSYGRPQDNANWLTRTDTNGCFVAEHRTNEKLSVLIGKEGYYNTRDEVSYFDTERNAVADGKWLPYGTVKTVVLKRIENPVEMVSSRGLDYYEYPAEDGWVGFDLQQRDWVPPFGSGMKSDMLIRFRKQNQSGGYRKTMEVSFTNNLHAGAYQMTVERFSDMTSVYDADTNATYSSLLEFEVVRDGKGLHRNDLGVGNYLVVRTRTEVDQNGALKSAHYGKIYGDWRFCERGGMAIQKIVFNPIPNSTSLEDAETVKKSERERP